MKKVVFFGGLALLAALVLAQTSMTFATVNSVPAATNASAKTPAPQAAATMSVESRQQLVDQYCGYCHDDDLREGGFSFSDIDLEHPDRNAEQTERIILKLRGGMMPPAGMPRPDWDTVQSFVRALETTIDQAAAADPNPGRPALYRLNRTEYRNSIRDLLDLDIDVESLLPADSTFYTALDRRVYSIQPLMICKVPAARGARGLSRVATMQRSEVISLGGQTERR